MHGGHRVVDIHCHLAPLRLARAVRAALAELHGWSIDWPIDPEEVLADILAAGVDTCVHMPYAHKPGIAESLNEQGVAFAAAHPQVLTFATVHPDDERPEAILDAAVSSGARGLKVHCPVQRALPDDPRLERALAWCEREDVPVLMHATASPEASSPYTGIAHLAAALERHPALRLCVGHVGSPEVEGGVELLARHEGVVLDLAGFPGGRLAADPAAHEALHAHTDRVLFASDYPNVPFTPQTCLETVMSSGLDSRSLDAVLSGNAARFLGLGQAPP